MTFLQVASGRLISTIPESHPQCPDDVTAAIQVVEIRDEGASSHTGIALLTEIQPQKSCSGI